MFPEFDTITFAFIENWNYGRESLLEVLWTKCLLTMPSNVLPLHQTFPHIIWIFTEDEGDGIFSTLHQIYYRIVASRSTSRLVTPQWGVKNKSFRSLRYSSYLTNTSYVCQVAIISKRSNDKQKSFVPKKKLAC